jgi:hypothetical protein
VIDTHHRRFLILAACVSHTSQTVLNIGLTVFQYTDSRFQIHIQIPDSYTELITDLNTDMLHNKFHTQIHPHIKFYTHIKLHNNSTSQSSIDN